jgi:hypothetical protein
MLAQEAINGLINTLKQNLFPVIYDNRSPSERFKKNFEFEKNIKSFAKEKDVNQEKVKELWRLLGETYYKYALLDINEDPKFRWDYLQKAAHFFKQGAAENENHPILEEILLEINNIENKPSSENHDTESGKKGGVTYKELVAKFKQLTEGITGFVPDEIYLDEGLDDSNVYKLGRLLSMRRELDESDNFKIKKKQKQEKKKLRKKVMEDEKRRIFYKSFSLAMHKFENKVINAGQSESCDKKGIAIVKKFGLALGAVTPALGLIPFVGSFFSNAVYAMRDLFALLIELPVKKYDEMQLENMSDICVFLKSRRKIIDLISVQLADKLYHQYSEYDTGNADSEFVKGIKQVLNVAGIVDCSSENLIQMHAKAICVLTTQILYDLDKSIWKKSNEDIVKILAHYLSNISIDKKFKFKKIGSGVTQLFEQQNLALAEYEVPQHKIEIVSKNENPQLLNKNKS